MLLPPTSYNCSVARITNWDLVHHKNNTVATYITSHLSYSTLTFASLYDGNTCAQDKKIANITNYIFLSGFPFNQTNMIILNYQFSGIVSNYVNLHTGEIGATLECDSKKYNCAPNALFAADNKKVFVYSKLRNGCQTIFAKYSTANSLYTYQSPNCVTPVNLATSLYKEKIAIVWNAQTPTDSSEIYVQLFTNTLINYTNILKVNSYKNDRQDIPVITATDDLFGIAWYSRLKQPAIAFKILHINGTFITPEIAIGYLTKGANSPIIKATNNIFVIGWYARGQDHPIGGGVYAQLIHKNGTKIGDEFRINNVTEGDQKDLRIVVTDNGFLFGFLGSGSNSPYYGQTLIHTREIDITPYLESKPEQTSSPTTSLTLSSTHTLTRAHSKMLTVSSKQHIPTSDSTPSVTTKRSSTITHSQDTTPSTTFSNSQSYHDGTLSLTETIPLEKNEIITPTIPQPTPLVTEVPTELKQGAVPETVVSSVQKTGSVASATSIAAASPTNVVLGSRIETASALALCNIEILTNNSLSEHSWIPSPGVLIGDYDAVDASNTLYTSLLIWAGIGVAALGVSLLAPAATPYAIGAFVLTDLFISPTIVSSAVTLLRFGTTSQQFIGGSAITLMSIPTIIGGIGVYSKYFQAKYINGVWQNSQFVSKYGILFTEYKGLFRGWMVAEKTMTIATGTLEGMSTNRECSTVVHWGTGVYSAHFIATGVFRPYNSVGTKLYNNPNIIFGSISFLQVLPFGLASFQAEKPEYKNNSAINTAIEIAPALANIAVTALTLKDAIVCIKTKCWKPKTIKNTPVYTPVDTGSSTPSDTALDMHLVPPPPPPSDTALLVPPPPPPSDTALLVPPPSQSSKNAYNPLHGQIDDAL